MRKNVHKPVHISTSIKDLDMSMQSANVQPGNENFFGKDGKFFLVRCYECGGVQGLENYSMMVAQGKCYNCGWVWSKPTTSVVPKPENKHSQKRSIRQINKMVKLVKQAHTPDKEASQNLGQPSFRKKHLKERKVK